ncbi:MAG: tRNA dihydrouridine synthase DusB [Proteobacteria bacterium]|nr:MAG: tRNA dihydrouridine synthase DusB [Pseudomonadota bacterium]
MNIGPYSFSNPVFLAPMAGITDKPFRTLCRRLGAAHAVSEMVTSRLDLLHSAKTRTRLDHSGEPAPVHVQIAGSDPKRMAEAARVNVALGADLIDINMGCPAKKVCNKLAGSSLLRDERLVADIIACVVSAVDVPVTLKTRTGWDTQSRNIVRVGRIAQSAGIAAITLHGRTRNDFYRGAAEHDSIKRLRDAVTIPLIANGDIATAAQAQWILEDTAADAVMIGRGAQARPWLPGAIAAEIETGRAPTEPGATEKHDILRGLVSSLHDFYGEDRGVRMARKHIGWQIECFAPGREERRALLRAETASAQIALLDAFFNRRMQSLQAA